MADGSKIVDFYLTTDIRVFKKYVFSYMLMVTDENLKAARDLMHEVIDVFENTGATRGDILLISAYLVAYNIRMLGKTEDPGEISVEDLANFIDSLDE